MNSHPKAFEKDLGLKSLKCGLLPTFFFFISNFKRDNFTLSSNNLCVYLSTHLKSYFVVSISLLLCRVPGSKQMLNERASEIQQRVL